MKKLGAALLVLWLLANPVLGQWVGYVYVERLNLTDQQTADLIEGLKSLGRANDSPYPNLRNHWRIRADHNAAIFEAEWSNDTVTAEAVKNRLATLFGVNPNLVTYTTTQTPYGPAVTYRYQNQNRVRFGVFGGMSATWVESWLACVAYLIANRLLWETAS